MLHFHYQGRDQKGELITGTIDSLNKEAAAAFLKKDGITPIRIEIVEEDSTDLGVYFKKLNLKFAKPTAKDLILFSKQMYSMLRAGVPIMQTIRIVADTTQNKNLEMALEDVLNNLESGQSLTVALRKHEDIFPSIVHSLVNVGENTGSLDEVFKRIAIHLETEEETRKRIKTAVRYPIMVICTIALAVGIINVLVVPAFRTFFDKFDAALPLPTRILIVSSDITVNYWHLMILGVVIVVSFWLAYLRTDAGRLTWDRRKLQLPVIGSIIERGILARFCRSFALTARSGVPLLESLSIIAKTSENAHISMYVIEMRRSIERGESLSNAAEQSGLFTPLIQQMITIGEETGEVDRLLDESADFYEAELDYEIKRLSETIEPLLISVVAVLVLILALGVFLPMWDISKVALGK